jgi:hypothetical protein
VPLFFIGSIAPIPILDQTCILQDGLRPPDQVAGRSPTCDCLASEMESAFKEMPLILDLGPLIGISGGVDLFDDDFPGLGQLGVQRDEMSLILRQIILGIDRLYRAFRHTQGAIDTLVGIDHQKIRSRMETVHRTHFHTVCVFAFDAGFRNNVGHSEAPIINNAVF